MTINQQRYVYRATEPLGKDLQKHIAQAIDLPITRTILEFAHTLIITFSSLHDVRKEYISTLSFFTPCVSCVWELLVHEIGLSPSGSNNVDIWKDALWVNSSVHQLLDLFLLLYNNHLFVMEKEEFVQQISPFTISTLPSLIQILKERNMQQSYCEEKTWLLDPLELQTFEQNLESSTPVLAMKVLRTIPFCIPFELRVTLMRNDIYHQRKILEAGPPTRIVIRRNCIIEDGFAAVNRLGQAFRRRISVTFVDEFGRSESGIDLSGVFKEFLEVVTREAFKETFGLFKTTPDGLFYPNPTSKLLPETPHLMEFMGRIIARAVYEGIVMDIPFAPFFLRPMFGLPVNVDDLSCYDAELYKLKQLFFFSFLKMQPIKQHTIHTQICADRNLMFVKHYEGDVSELSLSFSTTISIFDTTHIIDL
ncbi:hypothetical protein RFI_17262, partial [Reticulomyxa filosa]